MVDDSEKKIGLIRLKNVRLSFPKIWRAEAFDEDDDSSKKRFSANFLIDKRTVEGKAQIEDVEDAIDDAIRAVWGDKTPKFNDRYYCFKDGDDADYDGFADHMYLVAKNTTRPIIRDADGKTPLVEEDGKPYAGCRVNAWLRIYAVESKYGKMVSCGLQAIQFYRDDTAFGGGVSISDEEFTDVRETSVRDSVRGRTSRNAPSEESGEPTTRRRRV